MMFVHRQASEGRIGRAHLLGGKSVVLHHVAADESPGASKAGLAVHGECAFGGLRDAQKGGQDVVGRARAVWKVKVVVLEARLHKRRPIVLLRAARRRASIAGSESRARRLALRSRRRGPRVDLECWARRPADQAGASARSLADET